ncbi:hypothetical protein Acr_01g0007140 [Actinidia rufa]|uniref:Uncharacterized protein n=1 Tax=Actinidia rufa TaxID=165716 RepID=A0A7J0E390_9ERIC|nr:hypothetical protein Acr_01g0007140 [Actinidia rufa]
MAYFCAQMIVKLITMNLVGTPLPSNPNTLPEDKICYLGECGGDLLLIQTRMYYAMKFRMFEMDRDFSVLGVVKSANGEDVLVLAITGNFVSYNLNSKALKTLRMLPELHPGDYHYCNVYLFIESLYPV